MGNNHSKIHYRPANGYFGDAIPFYWEGHYHFILFSLHIHHMVPRSPYEVAVGVSRKAATPVSMTIGASRVRSQVCDGHFRVTSDRPHQARTKFTSDLSMGLRSFNS